VLLYWPALRLLLVFPKHFAVTEYRSILASVTVLLCFILRDHAVVSILISLFQVNKNSG
jgi:hypothetical protein